MVEHLVGGAGLLGRVRGLKKKTHQRDAEGGGGLGLGEGGGVKGLC